MTLSAVLDAALEGTLRRPPPEVVQAPAEASAEQRLLRAAAFEALRHLAGRQLPATDQASYLEPAPCEDRPAASTLAVERFTDLLRSNRELAAEWLALAGQEGKRLPAVVLPDVLDEVRDAPKLHEAVIAVGGYRLSWLAAQSTAWSFAAPFDAEALFLEGSLGERTRGLRRIRREDPARARELLARSWPGDSASARAALLEALEIGLSVGDEPLLERALVDRRRDIRTAALRLVRRLPESQFAARWSDRAQHAIRLENGALSIDLPRETPDAWLADGLDPNPPRDIDATAWVLTQLAAFASPRIWPPGTLKAVRASEWSEPLLRGLSEAVVSYGHEERTEALLVHCLDHAPGVAVGLLTLQPHWSEATSRAVLRHLPTLVRSMGTTLIAMLRQSAVRLHPAVLPELTQIATNLSKPAWLGAALDHVLRTLELRDAMVRELHA